MAKKLDLNDVKIRLTELEDEGDKEGIKAYVAELRAKKNLPDNIVALLDEVEGIKKAPKRGYVTGEDALKNLRAKGVKI